MKKLTRAQQAAWEAIKYLVEQNKDTWNGFRRESNDIISAKDKWSPPYRTLRGIEVAGLIEIEPDALFGNSKEFRLTPAGLAELAASAEDEVILPRIDETGLRLAAQKQAEIHRKERDALAAKLARAEAALREARELAVEELGEWSPVAFEHIPEHLEAYWRIRETIDNALEKQETE